MTVTRGLPFADYQAIPGVNWSTLKEMGRSPLHYRYGTAVARTDTPAMRFGRAVHTAVLEPDAFPLQYVVWEGGRRGTKAYDEFEAVNADRTILKDDEYATCLAVRDAVRSYAPAAALLQGESEVSIEWTDAETGIACKARLDHICRGALTDLKTTKSLDEHEFEKTSARLGYHGQLAFYRRALEAAGYDAQGVTPRIVAVESSAPYDVGVFRLSDDALRIGDDLVSEYLFRLGECRARDEWPGRYSGEQELSLPPWMVPDDGTDSGLGFTVGGTK